ncbi:hypothetical protein GGQ86_000792 [Xanthobacter flavus]|uniref:Uncharacterized protein n=1 Tax=Xanthobacter flavus TaxID=281 RepID=A0A9W6CKS8_XANFL|nr:hypothetical protein [Xanthobacter flavus]MDR6332345.1 hypothetical protein [Xanthobacter flavus]GLI21906.1 hypothetical protein XFLAVUS301_15800 [Xanthobacter flavus]
MGMTDLAAGFITAAAIKGPCRVATPGVNIALKGLAVLDAITLIDGDRVLVKDQTAKHENGIWIARAGNWERAGDFDSNKEVTRGTRVFVTDGFASANTEWWVSSLNPVPVGTGSITFAQASTAGAAVPPARKVEAGEGLSGGGDLTQNRTLRLDIAGLDALGEVDPVSDYVAVVDASDSGKQKKALAGLIAAAGSVPSSREITARTGLSGGGVLADDIGLALDLSEVTAKTNINFATDQIALHDPAAPGPARSPVPTFVDDMAKRRAAGSDALALAAAGARADILVQEEAVALAGATTDSTITIPVGAIILAVSTRVTAAITGAASFDVGTSDDGDTFAATLPTGAGSTNIGSVGTGVFNVARAVRFTANGGNFTGGVVRVALIYIRITPPTS